MVIGWFGSQCCWVPPHALDQSINQAQDPPPSHHNHTTITRHGTRRFSLAEETNQSPAPWLFLLFLLLLLVGYYGGSLLYSVSSILLAECYSAALLDSRERRCFESNDLVLRYEPPVLKMPPTNQHGSAKEEVCSRTNFIVCHLVRVLLGSVVAVCLHWKKTEFSYTLSVFTDRRTGIVVPVLYTVLY